MFPDQSLRLDCPVCSTALSKKQLFNGKRLARCRGCGTLLHIVPAAESAATPFDWAGSGKDLHDTKTQPVRLQTEKISEPAETIWTVEEATRHPYPNLQCPYCEYLNYDTSGGSEAAWRTQQYCANCGADLKKACMVCAYPLYVLDHFCGRCRTDQERAEFELEAVYWQRFNEGKRLAEANRWEAALHELTLFFGTDNETAALGYNDKEVREARQVYRSSIAGYDRGYALNLYHDCREQLNHELKAKARLAQGRRLLKYGAGAVLLMAMGLWSAFNLGAWWSIFVIIPVIGLILLFLLVLMLVHFGVGFN